MKNKPIHVVPMLVKAGDETEAINIGKSTNDKMYGGKFSYFLTEKFEPSPKEIVMNKKQAIEKYKDTPLYFDWYNKNSFYFKSDSEKISVTCSPCYMYDFEVCNKETIGDLLNYLDNDEISIWIDGKEILESENE